jgi:hypothetical protein
MFYPLFPIIVRLHQFTLGLADIQGFLALLQPAIDGRDCIFLFVVSVKSGIGKDPPEPGGDIIGRDLEGLAPRIRLAHPVYSPQDERLLVEPGSRIKFVLVAARKGQKRRCCPPEICDLGAGIHGRHLFQRAESSLAV